MRNNQIHNVNYLRRYRKDLRNNLTPAEAKLWTLLRNGSLEKRKFRRQHSIENYIVDFYCPTERLIIELDGQVHFDTKQIALDTERDRRLTEMNYIVLRFENKRVFEDAEDVLRIIVAHFNRTNLLVRTDFPG